MGDGVNNVVPLRGSLQGIRQRGPATPEGYSHWTDRPCLVISRSCYCWGEYVPITPPWVRMCPSIACKTWAMVASPGKSRRASRA